MERGSPLIGASLRVKGGGVGGGGLTSCPRLGRGSLLDRAGPDTHRRAADATELGGEEFGHGREGRILVGPLRSIFDDFVIPSESGPSVQLPRVPVSREVEEPHHWATYE